MAYYLAREQTHDSTTDRQRFFGWAKYYSLVSWQTSNSACK